MNEKTSNMPDKRPNKHRKVRLIRLAHFIHLPGRLCKATMETIAFLLSHKKIYTSYNFTRYFFLKLAFMNTLIFKKIILNDADSILQIRCLCSISLSAFSIRRQHFIFVLWYHFPFTQPFIDTLKSYGS